MAESKEKYVAVLDIGHGNCTVIQDGENVAVIDCGGRGSGLLEFINQQKITSIKLVLISHADQDHVGGLIALLASKECRIDKIVTNADASKQTELWNDFLYELNQLNESGEIDFSIGITRKNERINIGQLELGITGPTPFLAGKGVSGKDCQGRSISSNSLSATFHIYWNNEPLIYLAGDIDHVGLDDILLNSVDLGAKILVFPHHGGGIGHNDVTKFTEKLCNAVEPETVLFSIGRTKFNNPRPEIIQKIRNTIKNVRISCTQMSRNCTKKIDPFTDTHLSPYFARGREPKECCGGTFVIEIENDISYIPNQDNHHKFIKSVTTKSMCIH